MRSPWSLLFYSDKVFNSSLKTNTPNKTKTNNLVWSIYIFFPNCPQSCFSEYKGAEV